MTICRRKNATFRAEKQPGVTQPPEKKVHLTQSACLEVRSKVYAKFNHQYEGAEFMNIKEVSEQLHISTDTIRYWERVGVVPHIHRNASGYRDFTDSDIDWCSFAQCMRNAGVSIECLIEYIELYQQGPQTSGARKALLTDQLATIEQRMNEIQDTYARLKVKIDHYDEHDYLNPFKHTAK
ncbi:hypothetical protein FC18_GL001335 [Lacticaseibacillus sharpeae JCM 1186 = DSM 20505]|uniref:HTH merR-type domain-containing protein n=2 Tax=Lacticaseibacillus sharpeae TaxID=1626 RepID=A0A0R1ZKE5_9LACO|nr:hypothetical protein FC18_GL001335 [Lacticaseibacillus sharpeae JCM 1186 = DSM 20505]